MQTLGYREYRERGTFGFPLEIHHVDARHPQYSMPFHWHTEYEIIRILEGKFHVTLGEKQYDAGAGDILFISDGILHAGTPEDCVYECIVFDFRLMMHEEDICKGYLKKITEHDITVQQIFSTKEQVIHSVIYAMFDAVMIREHAYELIVKGALFQFFGIILNKKLYQESNLLPEGNRKRITQLKHALTIMEESYETLITLEQLSQAAGMSPKYFCSFFHTMTHKSPMEYLNCYRIEQACSRLIEPEASITEVAFSCGFNDLSYFIKTFRKYKGITPKRYSQQFAHMKA